MDETLTLNRKFYYMVLYTINFMTKRELVIVSREFYLHETHFFSFFKSVATSSKLVM